MYLKDYFNANRDCVCNVNMNIKKTLWYAALLIQTLRINKYSLKVFTCIMCPIHYRNLAMVLQLRYVKSE